MGKKIFKKKHRGYKDPLKQQQARNEKIKNKINNPPKNSNEQEISKKRKNFLGIDAQAPSKKGKKRKSKKSNSELIDTASFISNDVGSYPASGRRFKKVPTLMQKPNESEYHFFNRVSRATETVIKESQFQDQHKVDVNRNEEGEVTGYTPWKEEFGKDKKKELAAKERKKMKRKERELKKKLKKAPKRKFSEDSDSDDEDLTDELKSKKKKLFVKEDFKFGEVVHEPPTLDVEQIEKKVKEQKLLANQKFLFMKKLNEHKHQEIEQKHQEIGIQNKSKVRLKILEMEREKAILAYRKLKADKKDSTLR